MASVIALLIIAALSILIIRVGALALVMTGLSRDAAGFQALSAFFGVGFTTRESELVVNHPVRRRVIRDLIVLGNLGLSSVLATVVATAVQADSAHSWWYKLGMLAAGGAGLALLTKIGPVKRGVDAVINATLRRAGVVHALDYDLLLRVASGFSVAEVELTAGHALAGRTLGQTRLRSHGIVVMGVIRGAGAGREYAGVPNGDTRLEVGDTLIVYGRDGAVRALSENALGLGEPPGGPGGG